MDYQPGNQPEEATRVASRFEPVVPPPRDILPSVATFCNVLATAFVQLSIQISHMTADFERVILVYFELELHNHNTPPGNAECDILTREVNDAQWKGSINAACQLGMGWEMGKREEASKDIYLTHLIKLLDILAPHCTPSLADNDRQSLTTENVLTPGQRPVLPFGLRGTTDVFIFSGQPTSSLLGPLGNLRVVMQLKKPMREYDKCVYQLTAELFTSDLKADGHAIAVLTDLADKWTFQWLTRGTDGTQVLHYVRLNTKEDGVKALASVLNCTAEDFLRFHCLKVEDLNVVTDPAART
jgi:hypothetical protein